MKNPLSRLAAVPGCETLLSHLFVFGLLVGLHARHPLSVEVTFVDEPRLQPRVERLDVDTVTKTEPVSAVEGVRSHLERIFAGHGVPRELVWIAEVESSWNARAESHAGAVGLFQLMPETARRFGLTVDGAEYDERIHPYKSADAAAQYLKVLYEQFGSWHLALAAYNAGEGRVQKLLARYDATKYYDIAGVLPEETQAYVPRVLSIAAHRRSRG